MMAIARELITLLGFKLNDGPLKKAEAGVRSFKTSILAMGATLAASSAVLYKSVISAAEYGENLLNTSQKIGLNTDALQRLQYAAKLANVETGSFNQALKFLSKNVYAARNGSKEAAKSFQALGVDPKKFKNNEELLISLADKLKGVKDEQKKIALVQAIFGKGGNELLPLLNEGGQAIKNYGKELDDLNLIIDKDTLEAGDKLADNNTRLHFIWGQLFRVASAKLIPVFLKLSESFLAWIKDNKELIKTKLDQFFTTLYKVVETLSKVFIELGKVVGTVFDVFLSSTPGVIALTVAVTALGIAFGAISWPVVAITATIAALAELASWFSQTEVYSQLVDTWSRRFQFLIDIITIVGDWLGTKIPPLVSALADAFVGLFDPQFVHDFIEGLKIIWFYLGKVGSFLSSIFSQFSAFESDLQSSVHQKAEAIRGTGPQLQLPNLSTPPGITGGGSQLQIPGSKSFKYEFQGGVHTTVNVESGADPKEIGDAVTKATKTALNDILFQTHRNLESGVA